MKVCMPADRLHARAPTPPCARTNRFMQRVLHHLHDQGVSVPTLQRQTAQLPLVDGLEPLLRALQQRPATDCVILSDSNTLFIEWALAAWRHTGTFSRVFTNPARVDAATGRLALEPHDGAHGCGACPANMCKRVTLGRFLREQAVAGVAYDRCGRLLW